jgi:hypothetical protein
VTSYKLTSRESFVGFASLRDYLTLGSQYGGLLDPKLLDSETDGYQPDLRSIQQPIWRVRSIVQVRRPVLPNSIGVDRATKASREEERMENL